MEIIGRKKEKKRLAALKESGKPEFVAVYGRRRVGKTYLIREFFENDFAFYVTGMEGVGLKEQLQSFASSLMRYGAGDIGQLRDWFTAFERVRDLLEEKIKGKTIEKRLVVFIDEMPWLDKRRSNFMHAFEHFWNSWGSGQPELLLIACGSATTWIKNKLLENYGGLYNRVTAQIELKQFSLAECEEYFEFRSMPMSRFEILESFMVFGGIPHYMSLMDTTLSLQQNIDLLCFGKAANLQSEFNKLFASLFRSHDPYIEVADTLNRKSAGMTFTELASNTSIGATGSLKRILDDLTNSGFVNRYLSYGKKARGTVYKLVDSFVLFYLRFMRDTWDRDTVFWQTYSQKGSYFSWRGYAFENVCLTHYDQIKGGLGISGINTSHSAWRSEEYDPGVQIDLIIDRDDRIIDICEMKCTEAPYPIDRDVEQTLRNKRVAFMGETKTRKTVRIVMITPFGVKNGKYSGIVDSEVTLDDLFRIY